METLPDQFKQALGFIGLNEKAKRAQAAQAEIRVVLEASEDLKELGIDTVLIGSYRRDVAIYPGKDVDVFAKLTRATLSNDPAHLFEIVSSVLLKEYGDRARAQARSIAVDFAPDFSVDVVPAVKTPEHWAIPSRDSELWGDPNKGWVETDPERIAVLATARNKAPVVAGQGAYKPVVKLMRQARKQHLDDNRPKGFYCELVTYWTFENGLSGTSFAELFAGALRGAADHLASAQDLLDPALGTPITPRLERDDRLHAHAVFGRLADKAEQALRVNRCQAAVLWREILGSNDRGACFPLPPGCDETGNELNQRTRVASTGSGEAGGFA